MKKLIPLISCFAIFSCNNGTTNSEVVDAKLPYEGTYSVQGGNCSDTKYTLIIGNQSMGVLDNTSPMDMISKSPPKIVLSKPNYKVSWVSDITQWSKDVHSASYKQTLHFVSEDQFEMVEEIMTAHFHSGKTTDVVNHKKNEKAQLFKRCTTK